MISIVLPAKNEAAALADLLPRLRQAQPDAELLVVDDGSSDDTAAICTRHGVGVLRQPYSMGNGAAIKRGARAAKGDIIVTLDGDGQNDPADIPALLAKLRATPSLGMVSGVRVKRQDTASRRVASRLGNRFRNAMLGDGATDTGCGIKAFYRAAFLALPYFDHMHRYLIALVQRHGWKVDYAPVNHRPRLAGRSKYTNLGRTLVSIYDMLGVRWLQRRHGGATRTEEL